MNFKTVSSLMTCLALLLSFHNLKAQKTLEYGIGMGLNYTNLIETNNDIKETITEYSGKLSPSVFCRAEYNILPKLRFTLDPTILFTLAENEHDNSNIEGVYISSPIKAHYKLVNNFWVSSGISYNYLLNLSSTRQEITSKLTNIVDNRHLLSWQLGVNYNIKNWVELAVNYSRDFNSLFSLIHTDGSGTIISDGNVKNQMLQFTVSVTH